MLASRPPLDLRFANQRHLLLLDAEPRPDDLFALIRSIYLEGGINGPDTFVLEPDVLLTGPWTVNDEARELLTLPRWVAQAWTCFVPQDRSGPLPADLRGINPIMDAYPQGVPTGIEARTLRFLHAAARRLAGALRLAGAGVTIVPDPQAEVNLNVFTPYRTRMEETLEAIRRPDAEFAGRGRKAWAVTMTALPNDSESGTLAISAVREEVPVAVSGFEWAEHARVFKIRWHPPEDQRTLTLAERTLRSEVSAEVERIAQVIAHLTNGVIVDDAGFIVPTQPPSPPIERNQG